MADLEKTPARLRAAVPDDVPQILRLIRELADYERELHSVVATEEHLHSALFPADPASARSHALVAEVVDPGGVDPGGGAHVVAVAVWYVTFSTWLGVHGIWLEDLYVQPDRRGAGLGRTLLAELASICLERGYGRLEWWVLNWNEPSIGFYQSLGAQAQDEWTVYRLEGAPLRRLAAGS